MDGYRPQEDEELIETCYSKGEANRCVLKTLEEHYITVRDLLKHKQLYMDEETGLYTMDELVQSYM